jgi:hypothetical protein
MRRIIKKTVTVVTTTTWKISWEPDASRSDVPANAGGLDFVTPEYFSTTRLDNYSGSRETKETTAKQDEIQVPPSAEAPDKTPEDH